MKSIGDQTSVQVDVVILKSGPKLWNDRRDRSLNHLWWLKIVLTNTFELSCLLMLATISPTREDKQRLQCPRMPVCECLQLKLTDKIY